MERLSQLIVNGEGFVFDPAFGESFTVNSTGLVILKGLQEQKSPHTIAQELGNLYHVAPDKVEKDVLDFTSHLRTYHLL